MLLWLVIIISLLCAWIGFKKGFYVMFATLFNLMFAIFMSVFLTRWLMHYSSGYETSAYYAAVTLLLVFVLLFGVLEAFACFYFLRNRQDYFPRFFEKVLAPVIGFLCGYVICALLLMMVCVMPCSKHGKVDWLCTRDNMQNIAVPGVRKVCNFLGWYSLHCFDGDSEREIDYLLTLEKTETPEQPPASPTLESILNEDEKAESSTPAG